MTFAAMTFSTENIGDDIQGLAAQRFLPRVDEWIDRDHIAEYDGPPANMIFHGWIGDITNALPIPPQLNVLPVSIHVSPPTWAWAADKWRAFGERFGAVGARDLPTMLWLQSIGVDSYFSGCVTLTLPRVHSSVERSLRYAVDFDGALAHTQVTHNCGHDVSMRERFDGAAALLHLYADAAEVVTTRLHAALPCAAYGTPVTLRLDNERTCGLIELLDDAEKRHHVASELKHKIRKWVRKCRSSSER